MERQSWWQTISLIVTMLGIGAFIWLNVPTNNDFQDLKNELKKYPTREEMDARFDKLEALFNTGFNNLEKMVTIQASVQSKKS